MAARSGRARSQRRGTASRRKAPARRSTTSAGRSDKSVQAFREALDRSRTALRENVTISPDRLREVVDDAVERGRITRGDANELVSNLVSRGRRYTDDLLRDLEKLLEQARKEVDARTGPARRQATRAAGRVGRTARDVADRPLAEADKLRRRARVGGTSPITAYEQLTAAQIKARLRDLKPAELRRVRTQEKRGKARKGILDAVEKELAKR
jgi:polyhydroxyalkanoate synthesis regulator phasin